MNTTGLRIRRPLASTLLVALVAGCGGGGGGGSTTPPPPPPPPGATYTVTLQAVEALDSTDGAVFDVSGGPIDGATATME